MAQVLSVNDYLSEEAFGQSYNKERSICGEHTLAPLTKAVLDFWKSSG